MQGTRQWWRRVGGLLRGGVWRAAAMAAAALPLGAGCSVASLTGDVMSAYTVEHLSPYILAHRDLGMACETGVSMGNYLLSFERVTDAPNKAAVSTLLSAGMCAEEVAWQQELRGLRALFQANAAESRDARVAEKRAHAVAAKRYHRAFLAMAAAYREPGGECPQLDEEDQLLWMLGILAGVQSVQHDRASGGLADVPMDVPAKASRGAACLPNESWWGVPDALQAAVWLTVPGSGPQGAKPWEKLDSAVELGAAKGVRLASALYVQAAVTVGDEPRLKSAIARFANGPHASESGQKYQMLDAAAERQLLAASDRMWTQAAGHRTPVGSFGSFWTPPSTPPEDTGLLDDL